MRYFINTLQKISSILILIKCYSEISNGDTRPINIILIMFAVILYILSDMAQYHETIKYTMHYRLAKLKKGGKL